MAYDPEQRREAMEKVMEAYGLKVTPWAIASRVSRGTLQAFLIEKKTQSLGDEMYERLADGARALTGADITAATLRGEAPFRLPDVDVKGYVGAGEKITPIDDLPPGEGIRMVPCPIGLNPRTTVAAIVKGSSQEPTVFEGWIVFYSREPEQDIYGVVGKLCVVKTADGTMLLKHVRKGPTPGKFNLHSINAWMMEDIELEWASPVRHMQGPDGNESPLGDAAAKPLANCVDGAPNHRKGQKPRK